VYAQDRREESGSRIIHEPTLKDHRMMVVLALGHGSAMGLDDPRDFYQQNCTASSTLSCLWQSERSGVIERTATPHGDIGTSRY
jgi:hypothetical protein